MRRMDDDSIDLVVTSPPYDNLRDYQGYHFPFEDIARSLFRVMKKGGVIVWVVGDQTVNGSETGTSFRQALYFMEVGFNLFDTMIYAKNGFSNPANDKYHQIFEYMFVLSKGKINTFNPIIDRKNYTIKRGGGQRRKKDGTMQAGIGGQKLAGHGKRFNIWNYATGGLTNATEKIAYNHPAIFPERLAGDHIKSWSNAGDIVYDPFMGSGTTAKMAIILQRKYIGSELSKEYCQLAEKRIQNEKKQGRFNLGL